MRVRQSSEPGDLTAWATSQSARILLTPEWANSITGRKSPGGQWTTNAFVTRVGDELHVTKLDNCVRLTRKKKARNVSYPFASRRQVNVRRARTVLRNSIVHNWPARSVQRYGPHFVTLTYKGGLTTYAQIENAAECKRDLLDFLRSVKRRYEPVAGVPLRYKWVMELQMGHGRGAIHFHILFFNLPWNDVRDLQAMWSRNCAPGDILGNLDIERAKGRRAAAWYLASYVGKGFDADLLKSGDHFFGGSNGMEQPEKTSDPLLAAALVAAGACDTRYLVYEGESFDIPFWGVTAKKYVFAP